MENRELNQAAFEKVVRHLLKQGERSVCMRDGVEQCAYRDPRGLSCAVGCLLTDAEYAPRMDERATGIARLVETYDPPSLRGLSQNLLFHLQLVHDMRSPVDWIVGLKDVAREFGLTMPEGV